VSYVPKFVSTSPHVTPGVVVAQHGDETPIVHAAPTARLQVTALHVPPTHESLPHECPHVPQFAESVIRLTQVFVDAQ